LPIIVLSAGLAGCSSSLFTEGKLQPVQFFARSDWATAKSAAEANFNTNAPVASEDLVDASGTCSAGVVAATTPAAQDSAVGTPTGDLSSQGAPAPPILGGVALGMTECQVVQRSGQPGNIQISADANNDRATVLTYMTGPWPGIYRFSAGRLKEVERVAEPPPPKVVKKKKATKPKSAAR
jgi:hypothetical protein